MTIYRHKRRGTTYEVIGIGRMQAEMWFEEGEWQGESFGWAQEEVDMREVVIYRSTEDPSEIWVRPREEFEDGRFEQIANSPAEGANP